MTTQQLPLFRNTNSIRRSGMSTRRFIHVVIVTSLVFSQNSVRAADRTTIQKSAEKALALLQQCGPEFYRQSGCVACHQQGVTSIAVGAARSRGFHVDEDTAAHQVQITLLTIKSYQDTFRQRIYHPMASSTASGFIMLGLAAEETPQDRYTDANTIEMANLQREDGSWTAFGHRPPSEYSQVAATALGIRALQLYGPPAKREEFERRIENARHWLIDRQPTVNTDYVFRLLGLSWSGSEQQLIDDAVVALVAQQQNDGGWSQRETMESDAYATGLTLYALYHAGQFAGDNPVYAKGVDFLLESQLEDGSWHVQTRTFPFQKHFESGFPHGKDQWISASATGFAATALINSLPPVKIE